LVVFSVQFSVDDALDEVSNGRFLVVDEVAGADAIGGDDDFGMEAGTEQIDGDDGGSSEVPVRFERLAEQHLAPFEGGMRMAADSVADDLGGDHWMVDWRLWIED
jgi:hypothetical protein